MPALDDPYRRAKVYACPVCQDMGVMRYDVPYGDPDFGKIKPCDACKVVERDRLAILSRANRLDRRLAGATFANVDDIADIRTSVDLVQGFADAIQGAWEACQRMHSAFTMADYGDGKQRGRWCVTLYGPYGAGKSHLLAAAVNACTAATIPAIYCYGPQLWRDLGCLMHPDEDVNYDAKLKAICEVPVLALDEPGGLVDSGGDAAISLAARARRTHILEYRYSNFLPTLIADQRDPADWNDDRMASRIKEGRNDAIMHLAPDYRLRGAVDRAELAHDTHAAVWDRGEGESHGR